MGIHHIEDARTSKLLNDHLDSQSMTLDEEVEFEKELDHALKLMVDEKIVEVTDDETVEAQLKNEASWRDLASSIDGSKPFDELTWGEVVYIAQTAFIHVTNVDLDMTDSLRCVAKDSLK